MLDVTDPKDAYTHLLSATRELEREQRLSRDRWFATLPQEGKEELLFELEVLLKASACFANPRNHPGSPKRESAMAQDFREATVLYREGLHRAITLARGLLGSRDRAYVFHRYLETVLPEDNARTRLMREGTDQSSPVDSLITLRHGLSTAHEVLEGIVRTQRVPFRLFYAALTSVQREVGRNVYFNPMRALEFRPEFDRIKSPHVLELIRGVSGEKAHQLVALTFLSLFRMLRYVRLLQRVASEPSVKKRRLASRGYLILSVLRSDARALTDHLRRRSGELLAESFANDLLNVPASEIVQRASELRAAGHRIIAIKAALEGIAATVRLEMRRAFQHDLPSIEQGASEAEFRAALQRVLLNLRPALLNTVLFLGKALGASLEPDSVFDDEAARRETSERLRRDVWMFAQIVRAFASKAEQSPPEDLWEKSYGLQYVREFLAYFRAMGYPLLRAADYPRFDAFMAAMESLSDTDLVDQIRLNGAIEECHEFYRFLVELFDEISKREVLENVPFDRREAAGSLRLYLGEQAA
ncbi:MAG: hypothetical protein SFV15_05985 [Polyangiaceae bacterium]|nr:hypothetical protein [Polyangiaceae bacterium]